MSYAFDNMGLSNLLPRRQTYLASVNLSNQIRISTRCLNFRTIGLYRVLALVRRTLICLFKLSLEKFFDTVSYFRFSEGFLMNKSLL